MFYLTTHSTHFIYGYMASYIWLRTILIVRKKTRCRHICFSYRLTARVLLYAPSHRQDVTPVVEHWLERELAQWVQPMKDRSDGPSHHERTLYLWATSRSDDFFGVKCCFIWKIGQYYTDLKCLLDIKVFTQQSKGSRVPSSLLVCGKLS